MRGGRNIIVLAGIAATLAAAPAAADDPVKVKADSRGPEECAKARDCASPPRCVMPLDNGRYVTVTCRAGVDSADVRAGVGVRNPLRPRKR
jgi:hypothetical protein